MCILTAIVAFLIVVWLVYGAFQIVAGLCQIVYGVALGLLSIGCYALYLLGTIYNWIVVTIFRTHRDSK